MFIWIVPKSLSQKKWDETKKAYAGREVVSVFFFHSACKIISRISLKLGQPRKSMNKAARAARDELHLRGMEDRYVEAAIGKKRWQVGCTGVDSWCLP